MTVIRVSEAVILKHWKRYTSVQDMFPRSEVVASELAATSAEVHGKSIGSETRGCAWQLNSELCHDAHILCGLYGLVIVVICEMTPDVVECV